MSFRTKAREEKKKLGNANKGERRKEKEGLFPMRKLTVTANFDLFLFCTSPPPLVLGGAWNMGGGRRGGILELMVGGGGGGEIGALPLASLCDSGRSV